jgi:hypothetical protein
MMFKSMKAVSVIYDSNIWGIIPVQIALRQSGIGFPEFVKAEVELHNHI